MCCAFQPCEVVQFVSCAKLNVYVLLFLPPLPSFNGGFGKYWVGNYLHWLGQYEGVWRGRQRDWLMKRLLRLLTCEEFWSKHTETGQRLSAKTIFRVVVTNLYPSNGTGAVPRRFLYCCVAITCPSILAYKEYYYSNFIHCTNSDFPIGWFVPRDTGLWRNNFLDVIIMV